MYEAGQSNCLRLLYGSQYSTVEPWNAKALCLRKEAGLKVFIRQHRQFVECLLKHRHHIDEGAADEKSGGSAEMPGGDRG